MSYKEGDKKLNSGSKHGKCPSCGRNLLLERAPFCSRRCAQVDLGKWLTGTYKISRNILAEDEE
ncbi:MAG: DNA gyrase inhibitor YacG [Rhodospirillaceae bacterium]|nr:DNA gyrase inhibitor YacG [Rhodospirillaceae bacterium]